MKKLIAIVLLLMLVSAPLAVRGQTPPEDGYILTVSSVLPRFAASPFETDDWLSEIIEIDTRTGEQKTVLPLWGPNAIAYPNQVLSPRWSPEGDRLALVLVDRDGKQELALYNVNEGALYKVLNADMGYSNISPVSWSPDGSTLLFSAAQGDDELEQIFRIVLPHGEPEIITDGHDPTFRGDENFIYFLRIYEPAFSVDKPFELDLRTGQETYTAFKDRYFSGIAYSPDNAWMAAVTWDGVEIWNYDGGTIFERPIIQDDYEYLDIGSIAWSPDSRYIAFVVNKYNSPTQGNLSQVLMMEAGTYSVSIVVERHFPLGENATLPDDPRKFIDVTFQRRGAFLPARDETTDF